MDKARKNVKFHLKIVKKRQVLAKDHAKKIILEKILWKKFKFQQKIMVKP